MLTLLLAGVLLAAGIQQATACSCYPTLLQDRVCLNDTNAILFSGIVESVSTIGNPMYGDYLYVLKKVKVFQDPGLLGPANFLPGYPANNKRLELVTPIQGATCGVTLSLGSKWLIDAHFSMYDFALHTSSCAKNIEWPTTQPEKKDLKTLLKKPDCSCFIRNCEWFGTPDCLVPPHSDDECLVPPYSIEPECMITYTRCKRCGGVCGWYGRPNHCPVTTTVQLPVLTIP